MKRYRIIMRWPDSADLDKLRFVAFTSTAPWAESLETLATHLRAAGGLVIEPQPRGPKHPTYIPFHVILRVEDITPRGRYVTGGRKTR